MRSTTSHLPLVHGEPLREALDLDATLARLARTNATRLATRLARASHPSQTARAIDLRPTTMDDAPLFAPGGAVFGEIDVIGLDEVLDEVMETHVSETIIDTRATIPVIDVFGPRASLFG
jgi:hypothetical protein